jgi:hypothetical protein
MNKFPRTTAIQSPSNCDKPLIQFVTKEKKSKDMCPPKKNQQL